MNKWAVITGGTSGIGEAFVDFLAERKNNIIFIGRNLKKMKEKSEEIIKEYNIKTFIIQADLSNNDDVDKIIDELNDNDFFISYLINNAGFGTLNSFTNSTWEENENQINTMLTSVLKLSFFVSKKMKKNKEGFIINVSSLAPYTPNIPGVIYHSIKSAIIHFTVALNMELEEYNVKAHVLCPGLIKTNFQKTMNAEEEFSKVPEWRWMDSKTLIYLFFKDVKKGKVISIPGKFNKFVYYLFKVIPEPIKYKMGKKYILL